MPRRSSQIRNRPDCVRHGPVPDPVVEYWIVNSKSTSYEVYVLQRGRWELHARHPATGREAAIEEAKTLESLPNIAAVRVMREVYDDQSGVSSEYTIFKRPQSSEETKTSPLISSSSAPKAKALSAKARAKKAPPISRPRKPTTSRNSTRPFANQNVPSAPVRRTEFLPEVSSKTVAKLVMISAASVLVAAIITWVTKLAFDEIESLRAWLGRDQYDDILFGVFLLSFLLGVSASTFAFVPRNELWGRRYMKGTAGAQGTRTRTRSSPEAAAKARVAALVSERRAMNRMDASAPSSDDANAGEERPTPQSDTDADIDHDASNEAAPLEAKDGETQKDASLSIQGEKYKLALLNFLHQGLETTKATRPQLDTFSKFGINLFLAGANESARESGHLSADEASTILADCVQVLGTNEDRARLFADSYESYLIDPKYLGMIEAGRDAMARYLKNETSASDLLATALDDWNQRSGQGDTASGTIAVMFTDIVGSTEMTQIHGDAAAQEVVRTHNRIVRSALSAFDGREVKHTGDGIMAAFEHAPNAVQAAAFIQSEVRASNASNPRVPLGIKIGINAGNTIVEENDLFGSTVQLSARIVDKASTNQVMVSEAVRDLCDGQGFDFVDRGAREMKGFAKPVAIFEAVWDRSERIIEAMPRVSTATA
jgi:adenylate cyclase